MLQQSRDPKDENKALKRKLIGVQADLVAWEIPYQARMESFQSLFNFDYRAQVKRHENNFVSFTIRWWLNRLDL